MRSISRRKPIFSAGLSFALKGSLDQSVEVLETLETGAAGLTTALVTLATLGALERGAGFLAATAFTSDFLEAAFFAGVLFAGLAGALVTFFVITGRTAFFLEGEADFFGLEGKESVRAMGRFPPRGDRCAKGKLFRNQPDAARQKRGNQTEDQRLKTGRKSETRRDASLRTPFSLQSQPPESPAPRILIIFCPRPRPRGRPSRPPRSRRRARCWS